MPKAGTTEAPSDLEGKLKADFRLFMVLLWRFRLGNDPAPAMLDLAWRLQHGPDRDVIMAFRGFAKSWIAGSYALWRLYGNAQEKVLVVSGSLERAVATTNWCLTLIHQWPLLAHLKPRNDQRQSSKAFDVGPAMADQSPSFHALGVSGQIVGFRANLIIPDDVETQQNSITVAMRAKNLDAIKEFDSVLIPGGQIKFLGTPHDEDSMYSELTNKRGYGCCIYPVYFPTAEQAKGYGKKLSPWVTQQLAKLGPGAVGKSIMPTRFTEEDLAKRKLSLGSSEFALQFMLDTSLADRNKYPLRVRDLMVMSLDPRKGPDALAWSEDSKYRLPELPVMGFEGDSYHSPVLPPDVPYSPYNRIVGQVDNSGRGTDETALVILAELNGTVFLLHLWASKAGFEPEVLLAISRACIRFKVQVLRIEENFGGGMFATLLRPVLSKEWERHNAAQRKSGSRETDGGTHIEEMRSTTQMAKERRLLGILEPVTQQHRLVVDRSVIEWDYDSLAKVDAENKHRYSLMHQFTHLTRDKDSLDHDDRLDALGMGVMAFGDIIGVDTSMMAKVRADDRMDEEWERLMGDIDDEGNPVPHRKDDRAVALRPAKR